MPGLAEFLGAHEAVIHVRLTDVAGSSPREAGAEMFVAATAFHDTIGGGRLEYMVIDEAHAMLVSGQDHSTMDVPLGPEIGQCCGGRVTLSLTRLDAEARDAALSHEAARLAGQPHVYILGAGHVGRALAKLFATMPVRCILIDSRADELSLCHADIKKRHSSVPEADIRAAPAGSAFIILTHDHALDFLLTAEALARGDAAYVGLIGSATKRAKFDKHCASQSPAIDTGALICPIGRATNGDKRPPIIAALTLAEVTEALAAVHSAAKPAAHQA